MRVVSLASGSKGNCIFVESSRTKILVDDGISYSCLIDRLEKINILPNQINAILLTHEHSDHLYGIKTFLKKNKTAKVYIPAFVRNFNILSILQLPQDQIEWYDKSVFFINDLTLSAFVLPHDSHFCVGYSIVCENRKISIATDLGCVSQKTLDNLVNSDIIYFESNHDENLLIKNPKYSPSLKKRIMSNIGHLSNTACGIAIASLVKNGVKQVVLSHLSEENNTPNLAYSTIKSILFKKGIIEGEHIYIDVAYQDKVGTIFNL